MSASQNERQSGVESSAHGEEEQGAAIHQQYLEKKNLLLQFLSSELNPKHLQYHQNKVQLLKKSCFYLELAPKRVLGRDQKQVLPNTYLFQFISLCQFQRLKEVGRKQTEIQLCLLTDLLEQLEQGREELRWYLDTLGMLPFLSQWDKITQTMSRLSKFLNQLISLEAPGKLHPKHHLVLPLEAEQQGAALSTIQLILRAKAPPIFDRQESFAAKEGVKLSWHSQPEETPQEEFELHMKLLVSSSEEGYERFQTVTSSSYVVQGLQPGRTYEFTIRRLPTPTLILQLWHDSITLTTVPGDAGASRKEGDAC